MSSTPSDEPVGQPSDFDTALSEVLTGFSARIEAERRESPEYQALRQEETLIQLLRAADHQMMGIALNVSAVLRDKYDIHLNHEMWHKVVGLAAWRKELTQAFEKETHAGSVDRAFAQMSRELRDLRG